MGLIEKYGYQGESYLLQTEDGYLLEMHRILPSSKCTKVKDTPVLLQHGLLCSSADWLVMGPGHGLGWLKPHNPTCPNLSIWVQFERKIITDLLPIPMFKVAYKLLHCLRVFCNV